MQKLNWIICTLPSVGLRSCLQFSLKVVENIINENICKGITLMFMVQAIIINDSYAQSGQFASPLTLSSWGATSSAKGDLNKDGRIEFVTITVGHHFHIYSWNQGNNSFLTYSVMSNSAVKQRMSRFGGDLEIGDINKDGWQDIIVPESNNSSGPGKVIWFENPDGNLGGTWTEHTIGVWDGSNAANSVEHMSEVVVGDINNDGWLDVVTRDVSHGCFVFLRQNGGTNWHSVKFIATNPREGLTLFNPDNDSDLDILINGVWLETPTDPLNGTYILHTIHEAWYPTATTATTILDYASQVETGDFNGDGRRDVVITNSEELKNSSTTDSKPKGINVFLAPVDPINGTWNRIVVRNEHFSWHSCEIVDMDGDTDLDIVSGISAVGTDNAPGEIVLFLNNGSGTSFTAQTIGSNFIYQASVGDWDGDGDQDLLAPENWNSGVLRYYQNGGSPLGLPSAPSNLVANATSTSQINLSWVDQASNESGYKIERKTGAGTFSQIVQTAASITSYQDTNVTANTNYTYRVRAVNGAGNSNYSNEAQASTATETTPSEFTGQDIGSPGVAGNMSESGGVFTIRGGGKDIWGASDQFYYVYQSLDGDGEIIARVQSLGNTNAYAKAGVMMRETLAPNSKHATLSITPSNGAEFNARSLTGGTTINPRILNAVAPWWVRLVRAGSTFTAYASNNGSDWFQVSSKSISMTQTIFIGLSVTSHNNAVVTTAGIDNVTITEIASATNGTEDFGAELNSERFRLYPNPLSNSTLYVELHMPKNEEVKINLMNSFSEKASTFSLKLMKGPNNVALPVGTLPGGLYILILKISDQEITKRLLVSP